MQILAFAQISLVASTRAIVCVCVCLWGGFIFARWIELCVRVCVCELLVGGGNGKNMSFYIAILSSTYANDGAVEWKSMIYSSERGNKYLIGTNKAIK